MKISTILPRRTFFQNNRGGRRSAYAFCTVLVGMIWAAGVPYMHAQARAPKWEVDLSASQLAFTGSQTGKNFAGEFHAFTAIIHFAPTMLASSSVLVEIDMSSAATGERQRDLALRGEDWFNVKNFPRARFQAESFTDLGDGNYEAAGVLTIKEVTRPFTLPFHLQINNGVALMTSEVTLLRSNYNVGLAEWQTSDWVGLDVTVTIKMRAVRT